MQKYCFIQVVDILKVSIEILFRRLILSNLMETLKVRPPSPP